MAATLTNSRLQSLSVFDLSGTLPPQGTASTSTLANSSLRQTGQSAYTFQHGTGSGQCNLYVCQQRTIAANSAETLNLSDGSVKGIVGEATGFATLKFVLVYLIANPDGTTGASSLTVGNAASNANQLWFGATTHTATVYKSGIPFQAGDPLGKTVDATHCNLLLTNNDATNAATYQIVLAGLSN